MRIAMLGIWNGALCLGVHGCDANSDGGLTTEQSALSTALDACLKEAEDCRASVEEGTKSVDECREAMSCLPERAGVDRDDWRLFCEGIEERCADELVTEEMCDELRFRCKASGPQQEVTYEACYGDCMESGEIGDEECVERCSELDAEMTAEACYAGC